MINYLNIINNKINFKNYEKYTLQVSVQLKKYWIADYKKNADSYGEIVSFNFNKYTYLFDLKKANKDQCYTEDRVIGVFGYTSLNNGVKDTRRMRQLVGAFKKSERYKSYDKGHFISHKMGGGLDVNLYPQLTEFNRGWSSEGKLYRAMERYCEANEGIFVFSRPIYDDASWIPKEIDYGFITKNGGLTINRFCNRIL